MENREKLVKNLTVCNLCCDRVDARYWNDVLLRNLGTKVSARRWKPMWIACLRLKEIDHTIVIFKATRRRTVKGEQPRVFNNNLQKVTNLGQKGVMLMN